VGNEGKIRSIIFTALVN